MPTTPPTEDRDVRALVEAARSGDAKGVETLIASGVPLDETVSEPARDGGVLTALGAAAGAGAVALVRRLLQAGASPSEATALLAVTDRPTPLDDDQRACLQLLCVAGQPGWILRVALGQRLLVEDPAAVERLLAAGAPPNPPMGWGGGGGALFAALWEGRSVTVLELLLEAGADASARDRGERTPYALAVRLADDPAAEALRARGLDRTDDEALDALLAAAARGDAEQVRRLRAGDDPAPRLALEDHMLLGRAIRRARGEPPLTALLAAGLDPERTDEQGATALHAAARFGRPGAMSTLVAAGARLDARDHRDRTPLALALAEGRTAVVEALLSAHVASAAPLGETPGYPTGDRELDARLAAAGAHAVPAGREERFERAKDALLAGDERALAALLEEDPGLARARSSRTHHATLLHYLGSNGVEDHAQQTPPNVVALIELLLVYGASVDATCDTYGGGTAQTTLCLAASSDHPRDAGLHGPLVQALVDGGCCVDGLRGDGEPLATAIAFRQAEAVRALVAAGARVDDPLTAAGTGDPARVLALVDADGAVRADAARARVPWLRQTDDRHTAASQALAVAAMLGHEAVVSALLARGVDPSGALGDGNTALHEAAHAGHVAVVEALLDAGADARVRDGQFRSTPLVWAMVGGRDEVVASLLARVGADLVDAAELGRVDLAREALARGEDPNGQAGNGLPLRIAAATGQAQLLELLLDRGADAARADAQGHTAADYARARGHPELAARLER